MKNYFFTKLNFSKIFSFILLLVSLFILFFIFYRQHYFYTGIKIPYSNFYYLAGFLGIIFSSLVFFLPPSVSKKIFLIFLSSVITIYIIEYSINYINLKDSYRISLAKKQILITTSELFSR